MVSGATSPGASDSQRSRCSPAPPPARLPPGCPSCPSCPRTPQPSWLLGEAAPFAAGDTDPGASTRSSPRHPLQPGGAGKRGRATDEWPVTSVRRPLGQGRAAPAPEASSATSQIHRKRTLINIEARRLLQDDPAGQKADRGRVWDSEGDTRRWNRSGPGARPCRGDVMLLPYASTPPSSGHRDGL